MNQDYLRFCLSKLFVYLSGDKINYIKFADYALSQGQASTPANKYGLLY